MTTTTLPAAPGTLPRRFRAVVEDHLADVQARFVAAAVDAETQVTAAIEHCIDHHAEAACAADPHACLDVALAVAAADAAVQLVAIWLIESGSGPSGDIDLAIEAAQVLIAETAALHEMPGALR
jgi:hypothetical protein